MTKPIICHHTATSDFHFSHHMANLEAALGYKADEHEGIIVFGEKAQRRYMDMGVQRFFLAHHTMTAKRFEEPGVPYLRPTNYKDLPPEAVAGPPMTVHRHIGDTIMPRRKGTRR